MLRVSRSFLQYDVFTTEPLAGNQLAVFVDARGLAVDRMQALAREMNFSESTFILPSETAGTDVRMRIFTPATEMPMAGHPTIGSTFALAHTGLIRPGLPRFVFGLGVGPTPVDLEWEGERLRFAWMTQLNPTFGPELLGAALPGSSLDARAAVAAAIGLGAPDLEPELPVQQVSCGVPLRPAAPAGRSVATSFVIVSSLAMPRCASSACRGWRWVARAVSTSRSPRGQTRSWMSRSEARPCSSAAASCWSEMRFTHEGGGAGSVRAVERQDALDVVR